MAVLTRLDLPMPDGVADVLVASPDPVPDPGADDARRSLPGVLFVMDAFGVRPQIDAMAAAIADRGYVVLAPNVYYRRGRQPLFPAELLRDPDRADERRERMFDLLRSYSPDLWALDGPAYLDHLAGLPGVAGGPARVVGYCMGGALAVRLAAARPDDVACAAAYHPGGLVTDADDSPHRLLPAVTALLYVGYADDDPNATPAQQAAFEEAAEAAGTRLVWEVYPGALHGFTMADLDCYDEEADERHRRTLFWHFLAAEPR